MCNRVCVWVESWSYGREFWIMVEDQIKTTTGQVMSLILPPIVPIIIKWCFISVAHFYYKHITKLGKNMLAKIHWNYRSRIANPCHFYEYFENSYIFLNLIDWKKFHKGDKKLDCQTLFLFHVLQIPWRRMLNHWWGLEIC